MKVPRFPYCMQATKSWVQPGNEARFILCSQNCAVMIINCNTARNGFFFNPADRYIVSDWRVNNETKGHTQVAIQGIIENLQMKMQLVAFHLWAIIRQSIVQLYFQHSYNLLIVATCNAWLSPIVYWSLRPIEVKQIYLFAHCLVVKMQLNLG